MDFPLQFGKQTWKPKNDGELIIHLPAHPQYGTYFSADFEFVPPWLEEEDYESEHRTMFINVHGQVRGLTNLLELEGLELETREAVEVLGEIVSPAMEGPEIQIWSGGQGPKSIHVHAKHGWETRLKFAEFADGNPHVFLCELEAFFPSERAREMSCELAVKEFFGELDFTDAEKAKLLEEGWRFRYRGRLRFAHAMCTVPLNSSDPIRLAQRMAGRELGLKRFGFTYVNGGKMDGAFKPEDGVTERGRLVMVAPMTVGFCEWQERRKRKEQ